MPRRELKKTDLLKRIVASLTENLEAIDRAARASRAEATHESSKAESKYDTRGLEAAYLAGAQARQAREIQDAIARYESLPVKDFVPGDAVDLTALVELEMDSARSWFFIGPKNGGLEFNHLGREITVITPESPLGQALMGRKAGDAWSEKRGPSTIKHRILSVA